MSSEFNDEVESVTFDECQAFFITWLQNKLNTGNWMGGGDYDFTLSQVFESFLSKRGLQPQSDWQKSFVQGRIGKRFQDAAWSLAIRGVVRPTRSTLLQTVVQTHVFEGYSLTNAGMSWLKNEGTSLVAQGPQQMIVVFSQFEEIFGSEYFLRAREAVNSFNGHCYLACCVMCGAAAEAILLSLASASYSSRAEAEKIYFGKSGRDRIFRRLTDQKSNSVQTAIGSAFSILKHWRDESSHGATTDSSRDQAEVALRTLLAFAQTAEKNRDFLIKPPSSSSQNQQ